MTGHDEYADEVDRLRAEAVERERALAEARAENEHLRIDRDALDAVRRGQTLAVNSLHKAIELLRAENAELRRQVADELSREGQGMGLDETPVDLPRTWWDGSDYRWLYDAPRNHLPQAYALSGDHFPAAVRAEWVELRVHRAVPAEEAEHDA